MVTRSGERIRKLAENIFVVVMNLAGLAVKKLWSTNDFPAERGANGLMAEADSKNRKFPSKALDQFHGNARFLRSTRTRRNHNALGFAAGNFLHGDFVVAMHFNLAT